MSGRPKAVRGVLLTAARLLRRRGWCRFALKDHRGRYCVVGAINAAATGDAESFSGLAGRAIDRLGDSIGPNYFGGVVTWNNMSCRSMRQVLAALRKAATLKRERA